MSGYIIQLNELLQRAQAGGAQPRLRAAFKHLKKLLNQERDQLVQDPAQIKFAEAYTQLLAAIGCGLAYMKDDRQPLEPAWIHMEIAEEALQEGFLLEQQALEMNEKLLVLGLS